MAELNLVGFDDLDTIEIQTIQDLLSKRIKKINTEYSLLKIELKQHKHATRFSHEMKASLFLSKGKSISSQFSDANLYKAIDCVMEKLMNELNHTLKK